MKLKLTKKALLFLALIIIVAAIWTVAAVNFMTAPNSDLLTITEPTPTPTAVPTASPTAPPVIEATLSKVTLSTYNAIVGQQITASTTISDATPNVAVTFIASDGTNMGTANTNAAGTAQVVFTIGGVWQGTIYATATHP